VAHLIRELDSLNSSTPARCGFRPIDLGDTWLGSGNQTEIDRLETLRLCRSCTLRLEWDQKNDLYRRQHTTADGLYDRYGGAE
jgi:hypothetical protein